MPTMTPFFTRLKFAIRTFFAILFRDHIPHDVAAALITTSRTASATAATAAQVSAPVGTAGAAAPAVKVAMPREDATATQMLALLQRDGRLIDFLMEDITPYADAQIGAAVRNVHAGCRQALQQYVSLAPALDAAGRERASRSTPAPMPRRVKLIGNVSGQPPFTGVLHHRGWLVSRMELPPLAVAGRHVIAPAEIEVA